MMDNPGERVGTAFGKVILLGEHFAVHGAAAIALPLLTRSLTIRMAPGSGRIETSGLVGAIDHGALGRALHAMLAELVLRGWRINASLIDVVVTGDLPIAAGLGGSASLAAALVRALGAQDDLVQGLVHALEHLAHGRPSGVDGAVVSLERPILFEAGNVTTLACDPAWLATQPWWLAIVPRAGSTREAVARVAQERAANLPAYEAAATESDGAVHALAEILLTAPDDAALRRIGQLLDAAHARLARLGVSNGALEKLVASAREAGAFGAKLTGAGLGGAVIATAPVGSDLTAALYLAGAVDVIGPPGVVTRRNGGRLGREG